MNLCNEMEIIRQNIKFQKMMLKKYNNIRNTKLSISNMNEKIMRIVNNIVKYNACIYTITNNSVSFFMNSVNIYGEK